MAQSDTSTANATSRSGIRHLGNGSSVIPASRRADGSVRKEIRVKAGYTPPEDVERYKNRTAEAFKNRGNGVVPGAEKLDDDASAESSSAANKNAKRREARKRAAAAAAGEDNSQSNTAEGALDGDNSKIDGAEQTPVDEVDPRAEKAKEARKLAKKLRQARELQGKKDIGNALLPEQIAKVIKINELVRQLDTLGFDENGDDKAAG